MAVPFDALRAQVWRLSSDDQCAESVLFERFLSLIGERLECRRALQLSLAGAELCCAHEWRAAGLDSGIGRRLDPEAARRLLTQVGAGDPLSPDYPGALACAYRVLGQLEGAVLVEAAAPWTAPAAAFVAEAAEILANALSRRRAEGAMRQSEMRYRIISEISAQYAFAVSLQKDGSRVLEWFSGSRGLGAKEPHAEVALEQFEARFGALGEEGRASAERLARACQRNERASAEVRVKPRAGDERWMRIEVQPLWDAVEERVTRVFGTVRDVTDRVLAFQELQHERDLVRGILEASPYGILVVSMDQVIVDCNEAACGFLGGRSKADLLRRPIADFGSRQDLDRALPYISQLLAGGPVQAMRWTGRTAAGQEFLAELSIGLVRSVEGKPWGFIGVMRDLRERPAIELTLPPGVLSGADASELGDLVASVVGNVELALADPARPQLAQVRAAAGRVTEVLQRVHGAAPAPAPDRVLLCGGEAPLRRALRAILERERLAVQEAADPAEAAALLGGEAAPFAAALVGVSGGAPGGVDALRRARPGVPLVLIGEERALAPLHGLAGAVALPTPCSREQLLAALARAIGAPAAERA